MIIRSVCHEICTDFIVYNLYIKALMIIAGIRRKDKFIYMILMRRLCAHHVTLRMAGHTYLHVIKVKADCSDQKNRKAKYVTDRVMNAFRISILFKMLEPPNRFKYYTCFSIYIFPVDSKIQ